MREDSDSTSRLLADLEGLYQRDPQRFEEQRRKLIQQAIEEFPAHLRPRAYGLQFRLDAELGRIRDPVARMNRMVEIFWDSFEQLRRAINDPVGLLAEREKGKTSAVVIPFPGRRTRH